MEEVLKFLEDAKFWFIATDEDGQPHLRAFASQMIYEGKLYFQTGLKKDVAKQLLKNPKIAICAVIDDRWLRIEAEAVHDNRVEAEQAMLDYIPSLKDIGYAAGDGNTAVFYLKNAKAVFSSFTEEPRTVEF